MCGGATDRRKRSGRAAVDPAPAEDEDMSSDGERQWDKAFSAAGDMLGHKVELGTRRYGPKTVRYWVTCRCGYESSPGRSFRFAVSAGVGHLARMAEQLSPEKREELRRDTPGSVPARSRRPVQRKALGEHAP